MAKQKKGRKRPSQSQIIQWIAYAIGAALGAVFGYFEYGHPWLGALVGTGLAGPIALVLRRRFGTPR